MCGRYSCALHEETILNEARVRPENWVGREAYRPSYNVGPSRSQPVLIATKGKTATEPSDESHRRTTDEDGGGDGGLDHDSSYTGTHRELHAMRWGLWPRWSKTQDEAYKSSFRTINARSESVQEKVMFKGLVDTRRCVVLCEGYIEWYKIDSAGKTKQPYLVFIPGAKCLRMAGLYTIWTDPKTKEQVESYTVLTTTPNDSMKWLHDRTPVLLDNEEDIERWLDPDLPYNEVRELAKPYPSKLEWRAISKEIGNIKSEGPHLVEEVKPEKKKKVNSIANYFTKSPAKKRQLKDEPEVVAIKKPKKE